jgi:catechol 2,3-dioxygenase-like lactoylglutathione lyase family enzyme
MRRLALLAAACAATLPAQTVPGNAAGLSMGHVHIFTSHVDAQKKVWIDVIGGKYLKTGPLEMARFPGVFVVFRETESKGGTEGSVLDHFGFMVKDLAATRAKLKAAGVAIVSEMPQSKALYSMFPDQIKVEFIEDAALDVPIRFHHLHFASTDADAMRAWYAKTFDAVPGTRGRFKTADVPGANLTWTAAETPTVATQGRALDHIGFEVRDIKQYCAKLQAAGMKLDMPPTRRDDLGLTIAFLTDAWGTRIELTEGLAKQ